MVHYKLTYFSYRGRGELIRHIFAVAGQDFEDHRVQKEEWKVLKYSLPFGQLPILYVDGKPLAQSHAIARYLARKFGLNGKNEWEEAQVNAVADQFKDYHAEVRPWFVVRLGFVQGDVDKLHDEVFVPGFNTHFGFFSRILKANPSGYLVGDGLTWVDLLVAQHVADLLNAKPDAFDEFPEFKAYLQRVHSSPNLKKWIETRPQTPY